MWLMNRLLFVPGLVRIWSREWISNKPCLLDLLPMALAVGELTERRGPGWIIIGCTPESQLLLILVIHVILFKSCLWCCLFLLLIDFSYRFSKWKQGRRGCRSFTWSTNLHHDMSYWSACGSPCEKWVYNIWNFILSKCWQRFWYAFMCLLYASALWKDLDVDSIIDTFFFVLPAREMFFFFLMSVPPYIACPSRIWLLFAGVVLKMARVIKDDSIKGQKLINDTVKKPQTMIIPSRELVHISAKVSLISCLCCSIISCFLRILILIYRCDSKIALFAQIGFGLLSLNS